jgi:type VI secretion system protein VasD
VWLCIVSLLGMLSACSTPKSGGILDKTLELVGLQTIDGGGGAEAPKKADLQKLIAPVRVPLRIHASEQLNSDGTNRPLSLVVKIYKLRAHEDFLRAPYAAFVDSAYKADDLLSSREVVLLPGQRYEVEENLPSGASHLGIVALFKTPEASRWRFVFDLGSSKDGITLGAHQCALSVAQGETVGSTPETRRLAGTVCR